MLTQERHNIIRLRLAADGKVLAGQLAEEFRISEDTVRRDLRDLAGQGLCKRVYGGAILRAEDTAPIQTRQGQDSAEKRKIAKAAAGLVAGGQVVFIDAGSTNLLVAQALPRDIDLTVVTNAPLVANALSEHPRARILLLGGLIDQKRGAALGGVTLAAIAEVFADIFFIGTCACDPQSGLTAFDVGEAEVKRSMVAQSARLCVVATAEKLGTRAPYRVAEAAGITDLVTSDLASSQMVETFRQLGVRTLTAE
jgi:DeoR/GlpR family transcriptional regulator of sugar metabolism